MAKRNILKEFWVEPLEDMALPPLHGLPRLAGWAGSRSNAYDPVSDRTAHADREWWIYFLQGDDGGPIKIGRTGGDPRVRVMELQSGYPFGALRVVGLMRSAMKMERELHARFSESRMVGEWFMPTPALLEFIATIPRMVL